MLEPIYTKQFKKDVKKIKRSGTKDIEKLKVAIKFRKWKKIILDKPYLYCYPFS